jgi:hypothetical protein
MRQRNVRKRLFIAAVVTATVAGVSAWAIATQPAYAATTGTIVPLSRAGGSSFAGGVATGDPVVDAAEFDEATLGDTDSGDGEDFGEGVNQSLPGAVTGHGRTVSASKKAKSNPALGTHFQGLNLHDQRFANGGNQFSVEPPDQALCGGNGFLLESVNDVAGLQHVRDPAAQRRHGGGPQHVLRLPGGDRPDGPTRGARPSITDPPPSSTGRRTSSWSS